MRFPGDKPQWIVMQEEEQYEAICRKIQRQLIGKMCPDRAYIVEKMRRTYSKYGKQRRTRER